MKNWISDLWCKTMHNRAMWPIHGKYICPTCLREHRVSWEGPDLVTNTAMPLSKQAAVASRAILP